LSLQELRSYSIADTPTIPTNLNFSSVSHPSGGERGAGVFERGLARDSKGGGTRRPVEQFGTEFTFQLADLGADAGLADMHPLGRPGEVVLLCDCDEVFQLPQVRDWRF
jgi:hypothetical protein